MRNAVTSQRFRIAGQVPATVAAVLLGVLLVCVASASSPATNGVRSLDEARFFPGASPPANVNAGRAVRLPHPWWVSDPTLAGDAWYALPFTLEETPRSVQSLYLTAITVPAEVFVNGALVGTTGPLAGPRPRSFDQSQRFDMPHEHLRAGENLVLIHVRAPTTEVAGLGKVLVGSTAALRRVAFQDFAAHTLGPAAVAVVNVTVGLFLLFLWARRRDPSYVALFAAAAILWGLHTAMTLLPRLPIPQPHFFIWWHGVYLCFVALLCLFCVRFAGCRWKRYEQVAVIYAASVVPVLYLTHVFGIAGEASNVIRLGGIGLVIYALGGVARYVIRTRSTDSRLLLVTGLVSAAFAVHDWIIAQAPDVVRPLWLVPYAALAFLVLVGWILVDRFVRALNETERLNVDLEGRVAEKSAELAAQLAQTQVARDCAEAANQAKSRFLAAASHDLRQPMHAIGLFTSALSRETREADRAELVQRISTSVASLDALFASLLDVSKLDAGVVDVVARDIDVSFLFDRLANDFAPQALEKGLKLAIVPSTQRVRSDPMLLERILRNLLSNALRYTQRGGVVLGCRRRRGQVVIEVWDSGPGIAAEERDRIFEAFYQSPGNTADSDRGRGLGLGLAIVRRMAQLLDHPIELSSRMGRGTVFRVVLPRATSVPLPQAREADTLSPAALAGCRVLVVDDEIAVREATLRMLRGWGCEATAAADASAAIAALAGGRAPDAMLVDYRLGGGQDGLEAIASISDAMGADIPAVIVSGESHASELARLKASGFLLLHKPVSPARLRSALAWLLARDAAARDAQTAAPLA